MRSSTVPPARPTLIPAMRWPLAGLVAAMLWGCASAPLPPWNPGQGVQIRPVPAPPPVSVQPAPLPAPVIVSPISPAPSVAPAANYVESPALAARFPDPPVSYRTPAFEPGHAGYTTNVELRAALLALTRDGDAEGKTTTIRLVQAGSSQGGVPIEALHFSRAPVPLASSGVTARPPRPTVLLVGQQHGDEPAGSEALLAIAQELAGNGPLAAVLDRIDVVILPRANPDGAAADRRVTSNGIDVNRDHLLLRTPEAQAQAQLVRDFQPVVVVDSHEFAAAGRYVEKFGAAQRFDALVQYAMVGNEPEFVTKASEEWFRRPMLQNLNAQGLSTEWYYTTSNDIADKKISMGGVQPDTGRNVNGLRNAVSFLVETRGGGLGRAHLLRRVHTHVVAVSSVLVNAASHADDLSKLRHYVDAEVAGKACQGDMVVDAGETPSEYNLKMLDPQTGTDRTITVAWDSALELRVIRKRTRPCGYWLGADQTDAAMRLRSLGVQVQRLDEAGSVRGEFYEERGRTESARSDVRGDLSEPGGVIRLRVGVVPALLDVLPGSYYVGLNQPLANLVVAAFEPDSQNSFVANGIIGDVKAQARVMARPDFRMTPLD